MEARDRGKGGRIDVEPSEGELLGFECDLVADGDLRLSRSGGEALAMRAGLLEKLVGLPCGDEQGLRSLALTWLGRPGRDPLVRIAARSIAHGDTKAAKGRLSGELLTALEEHSPLKWRPLKRAERQPLERVLAKGAVASLVIGSPGESSSRPEVYPLESATLERSLKRVRFPVAVRISALLTPRRREIEPQCITSSQPFGRLVPAGVADRDEAPAYRVDAAERWRLLMRLDIFSGQAVPPELLSAIAADIRGAGTRSIEILLSGSAAAVDAEWRLEHTSGRGVDDWPDETARMNLREGACLFALPGGRDVDAPPHVMLASVPARAPRKGVVLGRAVGGRRPVAVAPTDLLRHMFIIGATGSGKSTCLLNMIDQATRDPDEPAVFVFDPHGSLAEQVAGTLSCSPDRVVFFDPSDEVAPMTWNPLSTTSQAERATVVDSLIAWAWEMWDPHRTMQAGMGPIAEQALRAVLKTALSKPGATLADALALIQDDEAAGDYLPHITDDSTRRYWAMRKSMNQKDKSELANYLTSKLSPFAADPALRAVVDHTTSTLDLAGAIDQGLIVLISVRKALLGAETTAGLIRLIKRRLWQAISARPPGAPQRRVIVAIDEATAYASELDEVMLAEARKFSTSMILATQNLGQARDSLIESVSANAATMLAYRVGLPDCRSVAAMLGEPEIALDLTRLPNFKAVARIPVDGEPLPPFTIDSPKPLKFSPERLEEVRAASRLHYGVAPKHAASPGDDSNAGALEMPCDLPVPATAAAIRDLLVSDGVLATIDEDGDVCVEGLTRSLVYVMVRDQDIRFYAGSAFRGRRAESAKVDLANRINDRLRLVRATVHSEDGRSRLILDWYLPSGLEFTRERFSDALARFVAAVDSVPDIDVDGLLE